MLVFRLKDRWWFLLMVVVGLEARGSALGGTMPGPTSAPTGRGGARSPNIIVILVDDLGFADLSCQGSTEVRTPRIDSLASNGIRFTCGYVSAPQCSPSRAGLLTGRYQNRFGFEYNAGPTDKSAGLPTTEKTIADYMKAAGYVTGIVGKWHVGGGAGQRPYERGFAESLWHATGGVYLPDARTGFVPGLLRGTEPARISEYSTDAFGREAAAFIDRHKDEPFFLYLAYITPHWPMEAKPEHLKRFEAVKDLHRRTFLAMMAALDESVGTVLDKLRETNLESDTLVFFLSDNGGPTGTPRQAPDAPFQYGQNTSLNLPLRGVKGDLLEGGMRVPFLMQWKSHLAAATTYDQPAISLDILPTALAAAGVKVRPESKLDGVNLLPFLQGGRGSPHDSLYWRFNFPSNQPARYRWAIRQGDWKLVKNDVEPLSLYNLAEDVSERRNLAETHADKVKVLQEAWNAWNRELAPPAWSGDQVKPAGPKTSTR